MNFIDQNSVQSSLPYNHRPENLILLEGEDRTRLINEHWEAIEFKQMSLMDPEEKGFFQSPLFNTKMFYVSVEKNFGYAIVDNWKLKELQVYRFGSNEAWKALCDARTLMFAGDNS